jgi:hypothetical protein
MKLRPNVGWFNFIPIYAQKTMIALRHAAVTTLNKSKLSAFKVLRYKFSIATC